MARSALRCLCGVRSKQSHSHGCCARWEVHCQLKCQPIRCVDRQPFCDRYAQLNMNIPAIPTDALNRFRHAASQYARTAKSRASRLLALKEDIAALRKRGTSYRAISELLTQSGITASDTCIMNFCHRILMERRHKPFVPRRVNSDANHPAARKTVPNATDKGVLPSTPAIVVGAVPVPTEIAPVKTRGPHIAKVELLPPGESYD
jgi:hypothetical protein